MDKNVNDLYERTKKVAEELHPSGTGGTGIDISPILNDKAYLALEEQLPEQMNPRAIRNAVQFMIDTLGGSDEQAASFFNVGSDADGDAFWSEMYNAAGIELSAEYPDETADEIDFIFSELHGIVTLAAHAALKGLRLGGEQSPRR